MSNKYFGQVADIMKGLGISPPAAPEVTFDEILSTDVDLDTIPLEELEQYLLEISAYNIFLKSQKGSFEAKLKILGAEYSHHMAVQTRAGPQNSEGGGWLSKEEKEAAALQTCDGLAEMREKVLVLEGTIAKIKDLPWSIDKKLDLLTIKLRRRIKLEEADRYERN